MAPSRKRGRKQIMAVAVASSGNRSGVSCRNCTASPALSAKHSGISCRTCSPTPASFGKHSGVSCHTSTTASPLNGNSLLSTPIKVLRDQRKSKRTGDPQREGRELRALVNCVVSVSAGVDEKPLNLLKDLLENGISPNTGIDQPELMKHHGGSALHIACSLDCPSAVKLLLDHGATLLAKFEGVTAVQMAFLSHQCTAIVLEHIRKLEECNRE